MQLPSKVKILIVFLILLLISIPVTLSLLKTSQETRSKAAGATTLSLIPQPGPGSSINKGVNDTVPIDVLVDPGTNVVSIVSFQVQYDPSILQIANTNPVSLISNTFHTVLDGPVLKNGLVSESISVGSNTANAIQKPTKIATLNFKAIATTSTPTSITFTGLTKAYSSGSNDQAATNILSSTNPATVSIGIGPQANTNLGFTLLLHGIGSAGDTVNPTTSDLSNKNPIHPQRPINVWVYNSSNQIVATGSGVVNFDTGSGTFLGQAGLVPDIPTGNYTVKVKSDRYLRKLVSGVPTITNGQVTQMVQTELVAGDTNNDNRIDVLDYNALLDCGYGQINPLPMTNSGSKYESGACQAHTTPANVDLDDNGIITSSDYNLLLREFSIQNGN